jgi:hypothetical protein
MWRNYSFALWIEWRRWNFAHRTDPNIDRKGNGLRNDQQAAACRSRQTLVSRLTEARRERAGPRRTFIVASAVLHSGSAIVPGAAILTIQPSNSCTAGAGSARR